MMLKIHWFVSVSIKQPLKCWLFDGGCAGVSGAVKWEIYLLYIDIYGFTVSTSIKQTSVNKSKKYWFQINMSFNTEKHQ